MFNWVICRDERYSEGKSGWSNYEEIKRMDENKEYLPVCNLCFIVESELFCETCFYEECPNYRDEEDDSGHVTYTVGACLYSLDELYSMILEQDAIH